MRVLIFEDNLMWSSRLVQTLKGLGHEPVLCRTVPIEAGGAKAAIVNLGSLKPNLIADLKALDVHIIGHAGHKETELMAFGKDAGCDTLATNSELTFKIDLILERINGPLVPPPIGD